MLFVVDELGVQRRPLLKGAIGLGLAPLGLLAAAPLVGGLIQNPHRDNPGSIPKTNMRSQSVLPGCARSGGPFAARTSVATRRL